MKRTLLLILFSYIPIFFYAQKLEVNKIDPVSHLLIKHTSWEKFTIAGQFNSYFRISQIDSTYFLDIRMILMDIKPFTIKEGQELVITMSDATTVKLISSKTAVSCTGCGAVAIPGSGSPGVEETYSLSKKQLATLRSNVTLTKEQEEKNKLHPLEHIKIATNLGNMEHDLSENNFSQLRKAIDLIEK